MSRYFILIFSVLFYMPFSQSDGQKMTDKPLFTVSTFASEKVNRVYIPPPAEFFRKAGSKKEVSVKFIYSGFPSAAIIACEYASAILETLLPDGVDITVSASWETIEESGVLANSSTTGYISGADIDAWQPNAIYSAALAEKIAGKNLNAPSDGDIELRVNSTANWYLGTDGKTPTLRYDLVTVILHELIHGLGFFDSFYAGSSTGSYGIESVPMIYDIFVENNSGQKLTDILLFPNPSPALKTQLTGGSLYFNGPVLKSYLSGGRSRLYTPSTFESGSSIAHLDEETYKPSATGSDALMTPFIARGEAIHDPGKIAMAMLGDLGWINTRVIHEPVRDTEENISLVKIDAVIRSDTSYNKSKVVLTWSYDGFNSSQSVFMSPAGIDDHYSFIITVPSYETRIDYYIVAEDYFLRQYRLPSASNSHFSVYIGTDTVRPVIRHKPEEYYLSAADSIIFNADVTDNTAVDTVYAEYRINEGSAAREGLAEITGNSFKAGISIKSLLVSGGDTLYYRIVARDSATVPNQRILPGIGWFAVPIERINDAVMSYETSFDGSANDFLTKGFEVTTPTGFTGPGLHTRHPYESPEESGDSIGYVALLRTPVIYDGNGMVISYSEIVLVEPGEEGSLFGGGSFYDYVIAEGSRDFGKTWFSLADGYDSRCLDTWETAYNSSVTGNNSTFSGSETMQVKRVIFPAGGQNISGGDTMIVRFRLFSDPYANGWGWSIDDLFIGPLINSVNDLTINRASLFPNPGNGHFTIRQPENNDVGLVKYSIYNSVGIMIISGTIAGYGDTNIDIPGSPPGLYYIVLFYRDGIETHKYLLKN